MLRELGPVPQETITSMSYSKGLAVALWSGELVLYHGSMLEAVASVSTGIPITRVVLTSRVVAGDVEGGIWMYDRGLSRARRVLSGVGGIQLLHEYKGCVVAGGWGRRIAFVGDGVEGAFSTERKVYCSDMHGDVLLTGQQEHVVAYDLRTNTAFFTRRFGAVVRSLVMSGEGFFAGTTDGRIYYEDLADGAKSYVFNAHWCMDGESKVFYPVNGMVAGRHLLSGGSDGRVLRWRLGDRKTCKEVARDAAGVSSLCIAGEGVAVGFSYSYDRGKAGCGKSRVVVADP